MGWEEDLVLGEIPLSQADGFSEEVEDPLAVIERSIGITPPSADGSEWERARARLERGVQSMDFRKTEEAQALSKLAREQREHLLTRYKGGSISERLHSLFEKMRDLFTSDELRLAERAVRALDLSAFCELAEGAIARSR